MSDVTICFQSEGKVKEFCDWSSNFKFSLKVGEQLRNLICFCGSTELILGVRRLPKRKLMLAFLIANSYFLKQHGKKCYIRFEIVVQELQKNTKFAKSDVGEIGP